MSALVARLCQLVSALPSPGSSVTLSRADLEALLGDAEVPAPTGRVERDLTVEEVAAELGRAPSTVRGWLIAGDLKGYKLNGRDWRVPRSALREYRDRQAKPAEPMDAPVDISAWRRL